MKTVMDAVIELMGDLNNARFHGEDGRFLAFHVNYGDYSPYPFGHSTDKYQCVCSSKEFNDLVSQMETNFGKCKQSYSDYKLIESTKDWLGLGSVKRFDYEPAKSDKELEVMDIDWSKAPEWASKVGTNSGVMNYWMDDVSYQLFFHTNNARVFFSNYDAKNKSSFLVTSERPQPKPAFTQEMCDNGELPSVGMECKIKFPEDDNPKWEKITWYGLLNGNPAFMCNEGQCWPDEGAEFKLKPLTPPIELIDGKAYQFELDGIVCVGFYVLARNSFMDRTVAGNKICGKVEPNNIQPLTVEVK